MHLLTSRCPYHGVVLLVLGVLFLLGTLNVITFSFMMYWPLFLVLGGVHAFLPCCKNGGTC